MRCPIEINRLCVRVRPSKLYLQANRFLFVAFPCFSISLSFSLSSDRNDTSTWSMAFGPRMRRPSACANFRGRDLLSFLPGLESEVTLCTRLLVCNERLCESDVALVHLVGRRKRRRGNGGVPGDKYTLCVCKRRERGRERGCHVTTEVESDRQGRRRSEKGQHTLRHSHASMLNLPPLGIFRGSGATSCTPTVRPSMQLWNHRM